MGADAREAVEDGAREAAGQAAREGAAAGTAQGASGAVAGTAEAAVQAALFPGAGSFGGDLRPLFAALGPSAWLVRYPGRFGSGFGSGAASYPALVDACAEQVLARGAQRCALVGHSFGAYVAYSTAAALHAAGVTVPALVVVGAAAPRLVSVADEAVRDPEATAAYLDSLDPGLLAGTEDDWRELVAETALHDLRLLRELAGAPHPPVACPVVAVRGRDDPLTSAAGLAAWAEVAGGGFASYTLPGGHSDPLRSPDLEGVLTDALRPGRGRDEDRL